MTDDPLLEIGQVAIRLKTDERSVRVLSSPGMGWLHPVKIDGITYWRSSDVQQCLSRAKKLHETPISQRDYGFPEECPPAKQHVRRGL